MRSILQQGIPRAVTSIDTGQNLVSPSHPVIVLLPTPSTVNQKVQYEKLLPRRVMIALNSIQLVMAILGILTQIVVLIMSDDILDIVGTGIWCGLLFGFSGLFGIIASCKPSYATIITSMGWSTMAAVFSVPLLVSSSASISEIYYPSTPILQHVMYAIQIGISLIEAIAAIASAAITCRAMKSLDTCISQTMAQMQFTM